MNAFSIVAILLETDDLKGFAKGVPRRNTLGDMAVGDVFQVGDGGAVWQITDKFYDSIGRYRRSYLSPSGKHVQAGDPGQAVRYTEYGPAVAYGSFDHRSAAAAEEPFNEGVQYLGTAQEWPPKRIWQFVKEVARKNRQANSDDYANRYPGQPNPYALRAAEEQREQDRQG